MGIFLENKLIQKPKFKHKYIRDAAGISNLGGLAVVLASSNVVGIICPLWFE